MCGAFTACSVFCVRIKMVSPSLIHGHISTKKLVRICPIQFEIMVGSLRPDMHDFSSQHSWSSRRHITRCLATKWGRSLTYFSKHASKEIEFLMATWFREMKIHSLLFSLLIERPSYYEYSKFFEYTGVDRWRNGASAERLRPAAEAAYWLRWTEHAAICTQHLRTGISHQYRSAD